MNDKKGEAHRWLQQACYDLKAAQWNTDGGFHDTACFLAQQAGEKALKSLMYYQGLRRSALMTHSLVEMVQRSVGNMVELGGLLEEARSLDLHYIPSRYPNGLPSGYPHHFYGQETAKKAIAAAGKIVDFVTEYYRGRGEDELIRTET
jgi:HEPN domain-containing protein